MVEHGVTIEHTVIGVQHQSGTDAVQRYSDDPRGGETAGEKDRTTEATVI